VTLAQYIGMLKAHPDFREAFVCHRFLPPRAPAFGPWPQLRSETMEAARQSGIRQLYCHQTEAIQRLQTGASLLVATDTASGKSLIYNMAVTEEILAHRDARALYIFPLKALEQDQLKNLCLWLKGIPDRKIAADIYDGDTTPYHRKKIRERAPDILFTNPDMLHRGILAFHQGWKTFFRHLSLVVLDEVHTYRGIFGSHLNQVIRRLKRLCRHYGSSPRFILLSATISNPESFGEKLVEEKIEVVRVAGNPRAGQHVVFLNPQEGPNFYSARLLAHCLRNGFRTIVFTQARKATELIHLWVSQLAPELRRKISSYRAGFTAPERRGIEKGLAEGRLLGVISTSALEMGIDIGYLDVCILVGYPGAIINTWQRGGRVGRSGQESMIILVGKPDALDQYFMKHPEDLFERSFEAAVLDSNNPYVVDAHLPCAAAEIPLTLKDRAFWPKDMPAHLEKLEKDGLLNRTAEGDPVWFSSRRNPALSVNIRSTGETYTIFDAGAGEAIGTVDGIRAFKECHPGAVYLHRSIPYKVDRLLIDKKDIVVHRSRLQYFTRTRSEKETEIIQTHRSQPRGQFLVRQGMLRVTEVITGYEKRALPGQDLIGVFDLDLPEQVFETTGFWIEIEPVLKRFIEAKSLHFMGGIHAIEHAAIGIFPLFALCDRNDVGGICYPYHPQVGKSAIFIYDAYPGGVGLAEQGFDSVLKLLEKTLEVIKECPCEEGCPSCIYSPKCGSGNKPLDKGAARLILEGLLGHIPFSEMLPDTQDAVRIESVPDRRPTPEKRTDSRILYLDLETQKIAQEVGGWQNSHLMRVSVAVLFDSVEDTFLAFEEDRVAELLTRLRRADLIIGFNIKRFDYRVLSAYSEQDLSSLPTFDILEDVHRRLGFRLGLDHLASETLKKGKIADALQAVAWFREGKMKKLTDYCRQDVAVTRDLFLYGLEKGHLIYRRKDNHTRMRLLVDWDLNRLLGSDLS